MYPRIVPTLVLIALLGMSASLPAAETTPAAPADARKVVTPPQDAKCMECHDDLLEEAEVHRALEKGCKACHAQLDAAKRPHKSTGSNKYGLDKAVDAQCLGCHEKQGTPRKLKHEALDKGCLSCHEAHSGKHKKLLKAKEAEGCYSCHKKEKFAGKAVHHPFKSGRCGSCHEPHSSDHAGLLKKAPVENCLECHEDVKETPHVIAGFSRAGHPLGDEKRERPVLDPLRTGKPFYCASCHDAHTGPTKALLRHDARSIDYCQRCHPM